MEKVDIDGWTPLIAASVYGHLEVVRYLLEQGANRDKANIYGYTSLYCAAVEGYLETVKLLMVYGADLNARNNRGELPIDMTEDEEIKQAIRDEPERRWNQQPRKRCIEQDQHPHAATSASAEQEEGDEEKQNNKKQPAEGQEVEGKEVADEDQDSEPSSDEDGN